MLLPGDVGDDLPPLIPSTNPLFPNAIVKKPPNTHAKSTLSKQTQEKEKKGLTTPRVVTGKNAPVSLWREAKSQVVDRWIVVYSTQSVDEGVSEEECVWAGRRYARGRGRGGKRCGYGNGGEEGE